MSSLQVKSQPFYIGFQAATSFNDVISYVTPAAGPGACEGAEAGRNMNMNLEYLFDLHLVDLTVAVSPCGWTINNRNGHLDFWASPDHPSSISNHRSSPRIQHGPSPYDGCYPYIRPLGTL